MPVTQSEKQFKMGHWIGPRRLISEVQIKIALLILAVIVAGALAIFFSYTPGR